MIHLQTERCLNLRPLLVLSVLALTPVLASAQSLQGVWRGTRMVTEGGSNAGTISGSDVQPRLLFYTQDHYSLVFVNGTEARPLIPQDPTDADLVAAWGPLAAQAGTYEVNGSTITYHIVVAKARNGMLPENATYSREFRIDGNTLETSGTNQAGTVTTTFTYRRVE